MSVTELALEPSLIASQRAAVSIQRRVGNRCRLPVSSCGDGSTSVDVVCSAPWVLVFESPVSLNSGQTNQSRVVDAILSRHTLLLPVTDACWTSGRGSVTGSRINAVSNLFKLQ